MRTPRTRCKHATGAHLEAMVPTLSLSPTFFLLFIYRGKDNKILCPLWVSSKIICTVRRRTKGSATVLLLLAAPLWLPTKVPYRTEGGLGRRRCVCSFLEIPEGLLGGSSGGGLDRL